MWLVRLADGKQFSANNRDWKLLPNLPIVSMMYALPNGKFLYLNGFERYCQLKEIKQFVMGAKGNKIWIWNIFGQHKGKVYQFSHHIGKNKTFQIVNKAPNWRPLSLIPRINKKDPLKFKFNEPRPIKDTDWHSGISLPQSVVRIID